MNWLVAVEGTNWQCNTINCACGENLEGVRNTGITFDEESYGINRFIWSPATNEFGTRYTGGMVNWLDDLISIDQRNPS